MAQITHAVNQLVVTVDKPIEAVVQRSTTHRRTCKTNLHLNIAFFEHDRQQTLVIHKKVDHAYRIQQTGKMELAVHNVAGVNILDSPRLQGFQVQLAPVEC